MCLWKLTVDGHRRYASSPPYPTPSRFAISLATGTCDILFSCYAWGGQAEQGKEKNILFPPLSIPTKHTRKDNYIN